MNSLQCQIDIKQKERDQLNNDIAEFLSRGGEIERADDIEPSMGANPCKGDDFKSRFFDE